MRRYSICESNEESQEIYYLYNIYMGAGILPTTIHNNKLYFLFGKENKYADTPGWSDIGGGTDNDETFMQTAMREGAEELTGFLGMENDIKKLLTRYGT